MAAAQDAQKSIMKAKVPKSVQAGLEALGKGMGVAAVELWVIFVKQYVVKGLTELLTAILLVASGLVLWPLVGYWGLVPIFAAIPFLYGTVMLLANPRYYAIEDITKKINELK